MPIRVVDTSGEDHDRLEARKPVSQGDPAYLDTVERLQANKPVRLYYDTPQEKANIARQVGRLVIKHGLAVDRRYGADDTGDFVSFKRAEGAVVVPPKKPSRKKDPGGDA